MPWGRKRTWQAWQIQRLEEEVQILRHHFPDFDFKEREKASAAVTGHWVSNAGRRYQLRLALTAGYPDEAPSVYVTSPYPLLGWQGVPMHSYGTSHQMHTWGSDRLGSTSLCAVRPESWHAGWTVAKVIQKAQLWLTAYEFHCETGKPVDAFLLN